MTQFILFTRKQLQRITPSLAALDNAQALRWREWIRGEPGEDVPQQYSTISRHLTPTSPRYEDMRLRPVFEYNCQRDLLVICQLLWEIQKKPGKENTKFLRKDHKEPLLLMLRLQLREPLILI